MTSDADIKKLFTQDFDDLPAELKRAIEAASPLEKILEIGKNNNLRIDQIGMLGEIINEFIFGYISAPGEFVSEIKTRLDADNEKSRVIAGEINAEIFLPIREALKKATGGKSAGDRALGAKDRVPETRERGTAVQEMKPLVIRPITMALPRENGERGIENSAVRPVAQEVKLSVPTRMEDVKIPGAKADLNGKISPIISRIGIQRTADNERGIADSGQRTENGEQGTGTQDQKPVIQEIKLAPAPQTKTPTPPRIPPSPGLSLYKEIKAKAERELKELIEKEKTADSGQGAGNREQGLADREQEVMARTPTPPAMPAAKLPPEPDTITPTVKQPPERIQSAAKPAIPPTPKPLKLPQEKIPKPQAPERYSTDPYRESVE